ncbi:hypothetical protein KAJ27_20250 [bacterium]|nr:hypothetical protein [bacterium]
MFGNNRGFATPIVITISIVVMLISMSIFTFLSSGQKRVKLFLNDSIEYAALRKAIAFHFCRRKIWPEVGDVNYKLAVSPALGPKPFGVYENSSQCNLTLDVDLPANYFLTGADPDPPGTDNISRIQFDIVDKHGKVINRYFLRYYHTKGGILTPNPLILDCINVNNLSLTNGLLTDPDVLALKNEAKRINEKRIENRPLAYVVERKIAAIVKANATDPNMGKKIGDDISTSFSALVTEAGSGMSGLCGTLYKKVAPLADQNLQFRKDTVSVTYNANTIKDCNKLVSFVCLQQLIQDKLRATMHGGEQYDKVVSAKMLDDINDIAGINKMTTIFAALQNFKKEAKVTNSFNSANYINTLATKGIISDKLIEFQSITDRDLFDSLADVSKKNLLLRVDSSTNPGHCDLLAYKFNSDSDPYTVMTGEIENVCVIRKGNDTTQMPSNIVFSMLGVDYDIYMSDIDGISSFPYVYGNGHQWRPAVTNFTIDNALFYVDGLRTIKYVDMKSNTVNNSDDVHSPLTSVDQIFHVCPFKRRSSSSLIYLFDGKGRFASSSTIKQGVMLADTDKEGNNRYTHSHSYSCNHSGDSDLAHEHKKHYYPIALSIKPNKWFFAFTAKSLGSDSGENNIYLVKGDDEKHWNSLIAFNSSDREKKMINITKNISGNFSALSKINNESFIAVRNGNSVYKFSFRNSVSPKKFDNEAGWQSQVLLNPTSKTIYQACYLKD